MPSLFKVVNKETGYARYISQKSHGVSKTALQHLEDFLRKNGVDNYTVYHRPGKLRYTHRPEWDIFIHNFQL